MWASCLLEEVNCCFHDGLGFARDLTEIVASEAKGSRHDGHEDLHKGQHSRTRIGERKRSQSLGEQEDNAAETHT